MWKNESREAFAESIDLDEVGKLCIFMDENVNYNIDYIKCLCFCII